MEVKIIPAINADSFEEVKKRIKLVEQYASWTQLDICDGTFTKNTTWHSPEDLLSLETPLQIEVHLMVADIEKKIESWLVAGVKRVIFQLEAAKDADFVIEKCRIAGKEVGLSIGTDVSWTQLIPYLERVDLIQILGVQPGLAGQKFREDNFDKIIHLREKCPKCIIEVDGGMNKETARRAVKCGANTIVAASAIFSAEGGPASGRNDIGKAIKKLKPRKFFGFVF